MFVTSNQFYVLIACVAYGGVSGVLLTLTSPLKSLIKSRLVKAIVDFFCFVIITFGYVVYSFSLKFPSFRVYMPISVILGIILYMKSFNILLAKLFKKLYNNIKKTKEALKHDGKKGKKYNNS